MKNISVPNTGDPTANDLLFEVDQYTWWATELHPSALRALDEGFEGTFRNSILKLMPAEKMGENFDDRIGRPTKELYRMIGLIFIGEFRDYTIDQTAAAWATDASVQYALDLPRKNQYVAPRTVDTYRKLIRDNGYAQDIFYNITENLVKELELIIKKQRLDSTHVLSDMAIFSRYQLLATGVKRFLNELKKLDSDLFEALDEEMRKRYEASDQRLCFGEVANPSKPTATEKRNVINKTGQDLDALIELFDDNETVAQLDAYQKMKRLFTEHFEVVIDEAKAGSEATKEIKLRKSSVNADGNKAETLQNTSDEGAGYGGPKGAGYQVQIAQAAPPVNEDGEKEGPGLLTALLPESAAKYDGHAVKPILEKQAEHDLLPEEMACDTAYGSDANVVAAEQDHGVRIISPVSGAPKDLALTDSEPEDESTARLDERRREQETDEWKQEYAFRSGIEGVNRALDLVTGLKHLRVRGDKAVDMALYFRGAGWNILTAGKIKAKRARKAHIYLSEAVYSGYRLWRQLLRIPIGDLN